MESTNSGCDTISVLSDLFAFRQDLGNGRNPIQARIDTGYSENPDLSSHFCQREKLGDMLVIQTDTSIG